MQTNQMESTTPSTSIDHPKKQIATIESKIQKLNKKMHTHIIITPPIGTGIADFTRTLLDFTSILPSISYRK